MNVNTTGQIAKRLGVNVATVRRWIKSGQLGCLALGESTIRVTDEQLDAFLAARTVDAAS